MAQTKLPELPATPFVGLTFNPDTTDAVGTITHIVRKRSKGKRPTFTYDVTYSFAHAPEVEHVRPYSEVRSMAWPIRKAA